MAGSKSIYLSILVVFLLGATIVYSYYMRNGTKTIVTDDGITFRLHRPLLIRLANIPTNLSGGEAGITIYGVLPNGKPFLIGTGTAELKKNNPVIQINPRNLYTYAKAWLNWAKRHNIDPGTIEPPGDVLISVTVPGKGVYTTIANIPTRIDLIAKGFVPITNIDLSRFKPFKVMDWSKPTRTPPASKTATAKPERIITCTPPECIPVNKTHFWLATSSESHDLVHLPVVLIHLNGPDVYQTAVIHLLMYLYTDRYKRLNVYFSGPAITYKAGYVNIGKPFIPDYTFKVRYAETKTISFLSLRVYNKPSAGTSASGSEFLTGKNYETEVANLRNNKDNYIAIGIMANVTYIKYTLFHCKNVGGGLSGCGPTQKHMYRTYIIPDLVKNNDGTQSIYMWYEIDPGTPYKGASEKAFENLDKNPETRFIDLGAHDGGIDISSLTLQQEYNSNPVLTVSGAIPITPKDVPFGVEISLFSVGMAREKSTVSIAISYASIDVNPSYAKDGYCETWPGVYITKDKLSYYDSDRGVLGSYPLTTMTIDAFMWSWPCSG